MSAMFGVTVLNRGQTWIDLHVKQVHPDAGAIPESACFALQLILEEAYDLRDDSPAGPIGECIERDQSYLPADVVKYADDYVESVRAYKAMNIPFDEDAAHETVDNIVRAAGLEKGSDEWDDTWNQAWGDWWASPEGPQRVILRAVVTDPKWIEHLDPGAIFSTASFDPWGPYVEGNRDEQPGLPADALLSEDGVDFPLSYEPRGTREMDSELIRQMASQADPLDGEALQQAAELHAEFLETGGRGGMWQLLSVSGMPMCIHTGPKATAGTQLVLRLKCIARGASLAGRELAYADLSGSLCEGVSFERARLDQSVAVDGFFDRADFSGASLREVDFSGASLKNCTFTDADLRGADFEHTDCTGAKLDGARFPGAILEDIRR